MAPTWCQRDAHTAPTERQQNTHGTSTEDPQILEAPEDLWRVVTAWEGLSEAAKSEILGVVKEAEELMKNQSSA